MRQKLFNAIALILCLSATVAAGVPLAVADKPEPPDAHKECRAKIRVKLGEHVFAFPKDILKHVKTPNHTPTLLPSVGCLPVHSPPLEAKSAFLIVHPRQTDSQALKQYDGFVTVGIGPTPPPYESKDTYERALEDGRLTKVDIERLPVDSGFHVLKYKPNSLLLIPADKTFVTPSGNPVVFFCSPYAATAGNTLQCGTNIALDKHFGFGLDYIFETNVPKSELRAFYSLMFTYIDNLEQKPSKQ